MFSFRKFHFRKWVIVKDTGKHHYEEYKKCGKRRIVVVMSGGYQPIDRNWVR